MPNPKMGTVTKDVAQAVRAARAGTVKYKVEKKGIIQAGVGKSSFTVEAILDNIRSVMQSIVDNKPEGLKGKYFQRAHITSSMGPGLEVDVSSVDPSSARFMLDIPVVLKK
jgi:large subunit ribosomal protein L1